MLAIIWLKLKAQKFPDVLIKVWMLLSYSLIHYLQTKKNIWYTNICLEILKFYKRNRQMQSNS
jgi:hypothetical protein